jgi:hypothetical protein
VCDTLRTFSVIVWKFLSFGGAANFLVSLLQIYLADNIVTEGCCLFTKVHYFIWPISFAACLGFAYLINVTHTAYHLFHTSRFSTGRQFPSLTGQSSEAQKSMRLVFCLPTFYRPAIHYCAATQWCVCSYSHIHTLRRASERPLGLRFGSFDRPAAYQPGENRDVWKRCTCLRAAERGWAVKRYWQIKQRPGGGAVLSVLIKYSKTNMGKTRGTREGGIRCFGSSCTTKCGVVGTWHFARVSSGTTHWLVLLCTAECFCWQQYETQSDGQKKRGQSQAGHLAEEEELLAKTNKGMELESPFSFHIFFGIRYFLCQIKALA